MSPLLSVRKTKRAGDPPDLSRPDAVRYYANGTRVGHMEWLRLEHEIHMSQPTSGQGREHHEQNYHEDCPGCIADRILSGEREAGA